MTDLIRNAAMPDDVTTLERHLRRALHRFDCPSAHTVGEYELDLLSPEQRTHTAAHILDCPRCTAELAALRSFLRGDLFAIDGEPRVGPIQALSRIVATLLPAPAAALSGVRGATDMPAQTYRAGGYTITLAPGPRSRRDRKSIVGLVARDSAENQDPTGAAVRLVRAADSPTLYPSQVDDLGNFAFDDVQPGAYCLELQLNALLVVIESLDVG